MFEIIFSKILNCFNLISDFVLSTIIFETITKIITFNVEESGADDILNILVYIFIQVRPKFIDSDSEYIELFKVNLDGEKQTHFAHLKSACDFITNIKYNNLVGVTQEEFNEKFKI